MDYSAIARKVGPPKAGHARVVVLREKGFGGIVDGAWDVQLDGTPITGLKTGTFAFADRPNGQLQLTATEAAFPGVTRHDITAQSGRTYFFVARTSKRKNAMIATAGATGGGILGLALSTALTSGYDNPGPIDFFPLDEATARTTIAELRLAQ
ncbi:DUF2846 domain-containing protein [Bradyrhizobium sp. AUGA SZCCT0283]|uniref:DUF2846 domain-containing protein n=1 Tax=Bradyrhizobium sp. AUGA SZCCT0283 TaxID=2807671 RepID=UPI002013B6BD|nr:DUF2846 domain-containing protein [Bradyrhizobium sp. AUGA SZCCT0283]